MSSKYLLFLSILKVLNILNNLMKQFRVLIPKSKCKKGSTAHVYNIIACDSLINILNILEDSFPCYADSKYRGGQK